MIAITGVARARTSLVMQTMNLLGIPITGEKYSFRNISKHNPKGYWELKPEETMNGIKSNKYEGKAVKLFGESLLKTSPEYISKVILCTRFRNHACKSFMKLLNDNPNFGMKGSRKNVEEVYEKNLNDAETFILNANKPYIKIDYNDWNSSPEKTIKRIVSFLGLNTDIAKAIENVEV